MNFGSKFVYMYEGASDEESLSDDDSCQSSYLPTKQLFGSIASSTDSQLSSRFKATTTISQKSDQQPSPLQPQHATRVKTRKADSNVFTLDVGSLVIPANEQKSSKYVCCKKCKAIMTASSSFQVDAVGGTNLWKCEFCEERNYNVDLQDDCKPTSDDVTYLLEAPPKTDCTQRKDDDHNVIFVIDISGSMGTTETQHTTDSSGRTQAIFVSRLDAVKKAAESQIKKMHEESPNLHIGLVAFGSSVIVYGDGTTAAAHSDRSEEENMQGLLNFGKGQPQLKPIKETYHSLLNQITRLDTEGMTALGPGLLIAIGMAAGRKGSQVIICTDGCANIGIGTLPDLNASEEVISNSRSQYKAIGEYARDNGISVSVISLRGTDCRLVHLGLVAQLTGGVVDIVDQSNLSSQFGNALSGRTLATNVTVTLILCHQLYLRDPNLTQQSSTKVEVVGNVTADTTLTIEYGVRRAVDENETPIPINVEDSEATTSEDGTLNKPLQAIPFQAQVTFTTRDDGKYMRVITAKMEQTSNREVAEAAMNIEVVGAAASRGVSEVALAGNHVQAKQKLKASKKLGERVKEFFSRDRRTLESSARNDIGDYEEALDNMGHNLARQSNQVMAAGVTNTVRAQNMMPDDIAFSYYRQAHKKKAP